MSWLVTGTQKVPVDPVFNNVSLLLHGNGANGSTTITDSSPTPKTVTAVGNAQISTAQSKFGGSSIAFDGAGDALTVQNNVSLQMESGNFTIEFWIYFNSISGYQTPFDKGYIQAGGLLLQTGNGNGRLIVYGAGVAVITETGAASTGNWIHYALVRSGTTLTLYRDGISSGSATNSTNFNNVNQMGIGAAGAAIPAISLNVGDFAINGYINDLRITKGVARYTANFTPPTAPFPDI